MAKIKKTAEHADDDRTTRALTDVVCRAATNMGQKVRNITDEDLSCLMLRIYGADNKTWAFRYNGTKKKFGTYLTPGVAEPVMTLAEARRQAEGFLKTWKAGTDPFAPVAAPEAATTINQLIEMRVAAELTGQKKQADKIHARYKKYIGEKIGTVACIDFDLAVHYDKCIKHLTDAGHDAMAYIIHADLHCLFEYAINKVPGIKHNLAKGRPNPYDYEPGERALDDAEIATLWHLLPVVFAAQPAIWRALRLQMVIGQRIGEICQMTDDQIDPVKRVWVIPDPKNRKPHLVPLSPLAWSIIQEAKRATNGQFFFYMWDRKLEEFKALTSKRVSSAIGEVFRDHQKALLAGTTTAKYSAFGIEPFTSHDNRRTMVTAMDQDLGVSQFVQSILVNHTVEASGDKQGRRGAKVTGIYRGTRGPKKEGPSHRDIWLHFDEKRAAMNLWSNHVAKLVGENVVPMHEAA